MQTPYDIIAWDPDIHRIDRFSVWPSADGQTITVRIRYVRPREEREVTIPSSLSAEYLGLQLREALRQLPELGEVDVAEAQAVGDPDRIGWNFVAHARGVRRTVPATWDDCPPDARPTLEGYIEESLRAAPAVSPP